MSPMLAKTLLIGALFALFAIPVAIRSRRWGVAALLIAVGVLDWAALFQFFVFHIHLPGTHWNWVGKAIDLMMLSSAVVTLILAGVFKRADLGLTLRQAPGWARALAIYILPFLLANALISYFALLGPPGPAPTLESIAFQATLPGLAEELGYRGLFLALFNRLAPRTVSILGAPIGYGTLATSLIFAAMHAVDFAPDLALQFSPIAFVMTGGTGLLLAWLRLRTGSLALPVLVHNATNLILILSRPA